MAVGLSLKLPIARDSSDGLKLIKNIKDLVKQQLKMLVLTNPGEMIMEPDYGCGIFGLLFEQIDFELREKINTRIYNQASKYMPHITVSNILLETGDASGGHGNLVHISIEYFINSVGLMDTLSLNF